ncbi:MAG: glucose-6-phosphate isomerase [Burkholderiaceae bacterium]|nr:glucose-6-phosphate isomerase [Burkholderiaceae bacterium]
MSAERVLPDGEVRTAFQESLAALRERARTGGACTIMELFAREPERLARLTLECGPLSVDLSRQRLPLAELASLFAHADAAGWQAGRERMFAGETINITEHRAAFHVALRASNPMTLAGDGEVTSEVRETLQRMREWSAAVRDGRHRGAGGERITDILAIGIGGSALGPKLTCEALASCAHPDLRIHFLANIDPAAWQSVRQVLKCRSTLAIISSKTWSTAETIANATTVREWLIAGGIPPAELHRHFAGVTTRADRALEFGLAHSALFPLADWVGGRYSLWSAIGLPLMLAIGADAFDELLAGARSVDEHFRTAPIERNAPAMLALVSLWNSLALGSQTEAVIPYSAALRRLPAYLQQLQMESNGKSVDIDGATVDYPTGAVIWGEPGTDAQHSFFQALHQGPAIQPVDFVLVAPAPGPLSQAGVMLLANGLAQAEALLRGDHESDDPHRRCPGNRPSTTILLDALTPRSLGALLALYEHKTASLGWMLRINSFDQWGVELGKRVALGIGALLADPALALPADMDPSTSALIARLRRR